MRYVQNFHEYETRLAEAHSSKTNFILPDTSIFQNLQSLYDRLKDSDLYSGSLDDIIEQFPFMQYYKPFKDFYQEEEDSTIGHNGKKYSMNKVLLLTAEKPVEDVKVEDLIWVLQHTYVDPKRVEKADYKIPVLINELDGELVVIDGAHRLSKAHQEKEKTIPAKFITDDELWLAQI